MHDLIKKRYRITNAKGKRLNGTKPYDYDHESVRRQIAFTWFLMERSTSRYGIVLGAKGRLEFTQCYRLFEAGDEVMIDDIFRIAFHIRHLEHTSHFATVKQLKDLLVTLRRLSTITSGAGHH